MTGNNRRTRLDANQVLKRVYNPVTQRLNVDSISSSTSQTYFSQAQELNLINEQLSTSLYTQIFNYVVTFDNMQFSKIKVKADTYGTFRIKINNVIKDYFLTSPLIRNCVFEDLKFLNLKSTDVITIEFLPDRITLETYNFFSTIEGILN